MKKIQPILLILLVASLLRLLFLTKIPPSLNWDEVSMGYSAYSLLKTGMDEWGTRLPLFFRSYGEWKSAGYIYLLVPFIKLFGLNSFSIRLPSALAGIISVYLTYLIGKRIYDKKTGLFAALFLAVSPWALMLSRPAFEANLSLTLILAGVYFFLRSQESSFKTRYMIYSAIVLGLAPHTYNSAKVVVPLLVLYLILKSKLYKKLSALLTYLIPLAIFAAPILLNLFSGVSQARLSQVSVLTDTKEVEDFYSLRRPIPSPLDKLLVNKASYTLYKVTDNYLSYFSPAYLLTSGGSHHQHSLPYHGVLYLVEFILLVVGFLSLKKHSSPYRSLPLVVIALGIIPAAVTRDSGHVLRSILTLPGWQLLAGLGATTLMKNNKRIISPLKYLFLLEVVFFLFYYFAVYPTTYARDWQYGHREVATYLASHQAEYDSVVMTKWFGEPQLFLAFYNQWDPSWYQEVNLPNLSYEEEGRMWLDQLPEYELGKYTFKYLDWDNEEGRGKTLYVGKFDDFGTDANILETVSYPDGSPAFVIAD